MTQYDLSQLRVLVVDDNQFMVRLVRTMLAAFGVRGVVEAYDGSQALERMNEGTIDLIILDWEMPILNGAELVRLVRNPEHPCAYAPIIMITGHTTVRRVEDAQAMGVNDIIGKPFSTECLYNHLLDNVLHPRPFLRTIDYFGPKPRLPELTHALTRDAEPQGVGAMHQIIISEADDMFTETVDVA
ncbi:MAG: response regulator [Pseudomonadota bacterium]